jgi:hypothetical protein
MSHHSPNCPQLQHTSELVFGIGVVDEHRCTLRTVRGAGESQHGHNKHRETQHDRGRYSREEKQQ